MNAVPHARGNRLLAAHCAALEPETATARDRLDDALGAELAEKLVFALAGRGAGRPCAGDRLHAWALFAA
jgi:hypothetical protein